jgi:hypothetical protein
VLTYTLTDGDPLTDSDQTADGVIVDSVVVGKGVRAPTLSFTDTGVQGDHITNNPLVTMGNLELGASWQYSTDNGQTWQIGEGENFILSGDGEKHILVYQTNAAGTASSAKTSLVLTLDTIVPAPPIAAQPPLNYIPCAYTWVYNLERGATLYYSSPEGGWKETTHSYIWVDIPDYEGPYGIGMRQMDAAGNLSDISTAGGFWVDTKAPTVSSYYVETRLECVSWNWFGYCVSYRQHPGYFVVNVSMSGMGAPLDYVSFVYDGQSHPVSSHVNPDTGYTYGSTTFFYAINSEPASYYFIAKDEAGNVGSTGVIPRPPSANITQTGPFFSSNITSNGTVTVGGLLPGASWQYRLDDGNWTVGSGTSFTLSGDGSKSVSVRQIDAEGHVSHSDHLSFILDTAAPSTPALAWTDTGAQDGYFTQNGTVKVNNLEPGASFQYSVNGSSWQNVRGESFTLTGDGVKNVSVRQVDAAGNVSEATGISFCLDTTRPRSVELSHPVLGRDLFNLNRMVTDGSVNVIGLENGARWQYAMEFDTTAGDHRWKDGSGTSFSVTKDGQTYFAVRQIDQAGNPSWPMWGLFCKVSELYPKYDNDNTQYAAKINEAIVIFQTVGDIYSGDITEIAFDFLPENIKGAIDTATNVYYATETLLTLFAVSPPVATGLAIVVAAVVIYDEAKDEVAEFCDWLGDRLGIHW